MAEISHQHPRAIVVRLSYLTQMAKNFTVQWVFHFFHESWPSRCSGFPILILQRGLMVWSKVDIQIGFSTAGDGCYVVNDRCEIVLWNEAAQRLLGFDAEEVLQRPCYEVIEGQREEGHALCGPECKIWEETSRGISIPSYYLLARRKDGESLWLNVSLLLIPMEPNGERYIAHLLRDASQEKHALAFTQQISSFIEAHTGLIPSLENPPSPNSSSLSKRQREILRLLAGGGNLKTIAQHLSISPHTVRNHLWKISTKLGLHSQLEIFIYALKNHRQI